jgi:hypothetical protein
MMADIKVKQDAAKRAYDRMMETLLGFDPCATLRIGDAQYIARMAQTFAFDAIGDAEKDPK